MLRPGHADLLSFQKADDIIHNSFSLRHDPLLDDIRKHCRLHHTISGLERFKDLQKVTGARIDTCLNVGKSFRPPEQPPQKDDERTAATDTGASPRDSAADEIERLHIMQLCYSQNAQFDDAVAACEARLAQIKVVHGAESSVAADCLLDLATVSWWRVSSATDSNNTAAEATSLCKLAIQLMLSQAKPNSLKVTCAYALLVELFKAERAPTKVEAMLSKIRRETQRLFAQDMPSAERQWGLHAKVFTLADMLLSMKLYMGAEEVFHTILKSLCGESFVVSFGAVEVHCCLAALHVRCGEMQKAISVLQAIIAEFEALPPMSVTPTDRLIMSRVLFQRAKHMAARGLYKPAVQLFLVTLRIRRKFPARDADSACDSIYHYIPNLQMTTLVEEVLHAISVLVSLDSSLEQYVDDNSIEIV